MRADGTQWVMKQALAKLRVKADWFSDPLRIHREALALRELVALAPAGSVPSLVFDDADLESWRAAILTAPHLLDRVSLIAAADRERLVALVAARMGADPAEDSRPGLLVQLSFAAADFAFGQWVRDRGPRHRPLAADVTDAVAVVAHPRWRG